MTFSDISVLILSGQEVLQVIHPKKAVSLLHRIDRGLALSPPTLHQLPPLLEIMSKKI